MLSRCLPTLVAALQLCGCAHSVLYDENRDRQAQAAVKAVAEAHLTGTVEALDKAYAEVAAREEEAARARAAQLFDFEVDEISGAQSLIAGQERLDLLKVQCPATTTVGGSSTLSIAPGQGLTTTDPEAARKLRQPLGLVNALTLRLHQLGLRDVSPGGLTDFLTRQADVRQQLQSIEQQFIGFYAVLGYRLSSCEEADAIKVDFFDRWQGDQRTVAKLKFRDIAKACNALLESRERMFCGGEVAAATANANAIDAQIAALATQRATAQAEIRKLTPDLEKAGKSMEGTALEAVEKRAARLLELLRTASKANDLGGLEILSADRIERLETLLAEIAGTPLAEPVDLAGDKGEDLKVTARLIRELPALKDEADKLLKDAAKPRMVPLLAAIEYHKQELAKIKALVAVKQKEGEAARNAHAATMGEAIGIANALARINEHPDWKNRSIAHLNRNLGSEEKRDLLAALAAYGEDVRRNRIDAAVWRARQLAAQYERVQVTSKYAAIQWDALMDLSAKVLADYHASGIRTEDINEFFKALGLVTIGVGAAQ